MSARKVPPDEERCQEDSVLYPGRWPRWHRCYNRGSIIEDGKLWCKAHVPSNVKARKAKTHAEQTKRFDGRMREYHALSMYPKLLAALEKIVEARNSYHGGDLVRAIDAAKPVIEKAKEEAK